MECVSCGKRALGLARVGLPPTFLLCTSVGMMPALKVSSSPGWGQTTCTSLEEITEDGRRSVESLHLPSFLQSRHLPLTMALSWDALDITTCLSLFNRTVEASAVHLLLLGCLIHSCQELPKVGTANEPEKMPAGKSHPSSPPPLPPPSLLLFVF